MKILIIEDEGVVLGAADRLLTHLGYEVRGARSVEEAQQCLSSEVFDAIVSDYHLGDLTADDLFKAPPPAPLIVCTARQDAVSPGIRMRAETVLRKPYDAEALVNALAKIGG